MHVLEYKFYNLRMQARLPAAPSKSSANSEGWELTLPVSSWTTGKPVALPSIIYCGRCILLHRSPACIVRMPSANPNNVFLVVEYGGRDTLNVYVVSALLQTQGIGYSPAIPLLQLKTIISVLCGRPHTSSIVQDPSAFLICIFIMKNCVSNINYFYFLLWVALCLQTWALVIHIFIMHGFVFMDLHTLALPFW